MIIGIFSLRYLYLFFVFLLSFICLLLRAWQTVPTCFDLFEIVAYFLVQGQNELPFDCRFFNCNRILSQPLINVLIFRNFPTSFSRSFSVWAATQPILTHTHTQRNAEGTKIVVIRFGKFSICPNVAAFCGVLQRGGHPKGATRTKLRCAAIFNLARAEKTKTAWQLCHCVQPYADCYLSMCVCAASVCVCVFWVLGLFSHFSLGALTSLSKCWNEVFEKGRVLRAKGGVAHTCRREL